MDLRMLHKRRWTMLISFAKRRGTSPGGDRWDFVKCDGRWWITGLTCSLEPK